MTEAPLLLRTPTPHLTESLQGYVLRLSEANGYDTPWHVLTLAGFSQGEMRGAGFPHRKLARVLSEDPGRLDAIAYHTTDEAGDRVFRLLGHRLGQGLSTGWLRLSTSHLCCRCVSEHGFVDALFDMSMAVACPIHRTWLTERCPACAKPLQFLRQGLLVCRCGARVDRAAEEAADPAVADLMAVLRAVLHRAPVASDLTQGLPVENLTAMPLSTIVRWLPVMARFAAAPATDAKAVAVACARALADWPRGFHAYMGEVGRRVGMHAETSFRKRFLPFYDAMFKAKAEHRTPRDLTWLRDEFVRYGATKEPDAVVDPRLMRRLGDNAPKRLLTQGEMLKGLGVHQATLHRLVERGAVGAVQIGGTKRTARMFDAAACAPLFEVARELGRPMQARAAAAWLEIPVRTLERLTERGVYEQRLRLRQAARYYSGELDAFRERLAARARRLDSMPPYASAAVSLAHALRESRFHDHDAKAQFVVDYLEARIEPIGRVGDKLSDIIFSRAVLNEQVAKSRSQASGGTLSAREAGRRIDSTSEVVHELVRLGILPGAPGREGIRLLAADVDAFATRWTPLANVAVQCGTRSRSLSRIARSLDIPLIEPSHKGRILKTFVERTRCGDLVHQFRLARTDSKPPTD